jgi:hypothetical protein
MASGAGWEKEAVDVLRVNGGEATEIMVIWTQ